MASTSCKLPQQTSLRFGVPFVPCRQPTRHVCKTATVQPVAEPWQPEIEESSAVPQLVSRFVREREESYTKPSITDSGTLRPGPEWFPEWMKYRRREDNYVFWQDKFVRCSLDIPMIEKRWTVFSTFWYLVMWAKYYAVPPAVRFIWYLCWRGFRQALYEAHKCLVLWQCKLDAHLASCGSNGVVQTFSKTMALRRLHWKNSIMAEVLYALNLWKTGRIYLLPPVQQPLDRPTFFFLF